MFFNYFHALFLHVLFLLSTAHKIHVSLSDFTCLAKNNKTHLSIKKDVQCKYVGQDTASCLL